MIYLARFLTLLLLLLLSSKFSDSFPGYWDVAIYLTVFVITDFAITKAFSKNVEKTQSGVTVEKPQEQRD